MTKATTYRGFQVVPNFTSIHGTMRPLAKQRGWVVILPGYGSLGWEPSMAEVRACVDSLRSGECNSHIAKALARLDAKAAAEVAA